jgi:hypothetical protein
VKVVTPFLLEYLEAKRHLWNVHFRGRFKSLMKSSPLDEYEQIDRLLFTVIVLDELGLPRTMINDYGRQPLPLLRVKPKTRSPVVSMMFCTPLPGGNRSWEARESVTVAPAAHFGFIDFFDWYPYEFAGYPFYRVRVDEQSHLPGRVGQDGLIEILTSDVILLDQSQID